MAPRVIVLGAGITGLSSADCVQRACPQAHVQLVSEDFSPKTTGDGSAGFWEPYLMTDSAAQMVKRVSAVTFKHLTSLAYSPLAGVVKTQMLSGYHLCAGVPKEVPSYADTFENYRDLSKKEMERFPDAEWGTFSTTVSVDVTPYMAWLMRSFKAQGGIVRRQKVTTIEEIASECDILINCSATSSRYLFNDDGVFPVRGQVWKVRAPWLKHFYVWDNHGKGHTYILPGVDYVTVGGTAQVGDWNRQPDSQDAARIWENAVEFLPALRQATPLKSWAGLRPSRESPRLECQPMKVLGRTIKVIHNYGHGGSGVTMHWGCALEVARMVLEALGTEENEAKQIVSRL
ncbi:D-aspartate oxidase [Plakobranchus ocellatus]|uniref:D-aspartate oxidase n=1 Tax=Plakobranchus ocellatus TaxID=259542 RepID=A0AAV3ZKV9_9GAST|nr:D-aspartate oxidase [Plakobranchus ocellatus]